MAKIKQYKIELYFSSNDYEALKAYSLDNKGGTSKSELEDMVRGIVDDYLSDAGY